MNKNARKLIPAVAMLLVSASMLSTASFAWFSMNSKVTANGMKVNVVTPGDLLISDKAGTYQRNITSIDLTEATNKKIVPVSSINGTDTSFYYADTKDINSTTGGIGAATEVKAVGTDYSTTIEKVYGTNVQPYVDYTFFVKNTANVNKEIVYKQDTTSGSEIGVFKYASSGDTSANAIKALRYTIFVAEGTSVTSATANPANAVMANQEITNKAWTAEKLDSYTSAEGNVASWDSNTLFTATAGTEYTVKVRIWLDGEDSNCITSNFVALTSDFELDIALMIKE